MLCNGVAPVVRQIRHCRSATLASRIISRWLVLTLQQFSGLSHSRGGPAKFTGRDARKTGQMTPAEGRARRSKFFRNRLVIFFGMQRAVFTDGKTQQQIKQWARCMAQFAVTMHDCRRPGLQVLPNRLLDVAEQRGGVIGPDLVEVAVNWQRVPME